MGFFERAAAAQRVGDHARAFIVLSAGLKRQPDHQDALDELVHLYIHDIPNPGMERDLLAVLDVQVTGLDTFDVIVAELQEAGDHHKIRALEEVRDRGGFLSNPPVEEPPPPLVAKPLVSRRASLQEELWESFSDPNQAPAEVIPFVAPELPREPEVVRESPSFHRPRTKTVEHPTPSLPTQPLTETPFPWAISLSVVALLLSSVSLYISLSRPAETASGFDPETEATASAIEDLNETPQEVESTTVPAVPELPPRRDLTVDEDETDQLEEQPQEQENP